MKWMPENGSIVPGDFIVSGLLEIFHSKVESNVVLQKVKKSSL